MKPSTITGLTILALSCCAGIVEARSFVCAGGQTVQIDDEHTTEIVQYTDLYTLRLYTNKHYPGHKKLWQLATYTEHRTVFDVGFKILFTNFRTDPPTVAEFENCR